MQWVGFMTIRPPDNSAPGLFGPKMDYSALGLFGPWTIRPWTIPPLDYSAPGLFDLRTSNTTIPHSVIHDIFEKKIAFGRRLQTWEEQ